MSLFKRLPGKLAEYVAAEKLNGIAPWTPSPRPVLQPVEHKARLLTNASG